MVLKNVKEIKYKVLILIAHLTLASTRVIQGKTTCCGVPHVAKATIGKFLSLAKQPGVRDAEVS